MTKTFPKQALAKRWVQDTEFALDRSERVTREAVVGDLFKRYIKEILPLRTISKCGAYRYTQLMRWTDDLTLSDLSAERLMRWKEMRCPKASPVSFDRYIANIWSVIYDAEAFWGVDIPTAEMRKARGLLKRIGITIASSRARERRPHAGEIDRIKAAAGTTIPFADILDFAAITGMRIGEITQLRWADLDEKEKMIMVRNRKHPTRKLGNDWNVPLLLDSLAILQRQPKCPITGLIFPYKSASVTAVFQRAKKVAEIPDLNLHDLRHEAISSMFENGFSIAEVSLVSGHLTWASLRRYTNLKPQSLHTGPVTKTPIAQEDSIEESA